MVTKLKVNDDNMAGEFYGIRVKDDWYICENLREVADVLADHKLTRKDIGACVSKCSLYMLRAGDIGRLEVYLEEVALRKERKIPRKRNK